MYTNKSNFITSIIILCASLIFSVLNAQDIVEKDWVLSRGIKFGIPQAAHYNPADGLLYVTRRSNYSGGLYRINASGDSTRLWSSPSYTILSGLVVDHSTGDIYTANIWGEGSAASIFRTEFSTTNRDDWVYTYDLSYEDDPIGLAFASTSITGIVNAGEALLVDGGVDDPVNESRDGIWKFDPATSGFKQQLFAEDNITLKHAVDITIGTHEVYLVDTGEDPKESYLPDPNGPSDGKLFRLEESGSSIILTEIALETASVPVTLQDPVGIATDPLTQDLFVFDYNSTEGRLLRIDVNGTIGEVSVVVEGFTTVPAWGDADPNYRRDNYANVDITPDGRQIIITDKVADSIYVFKKSWTLTGSDIYNSNSGNVAVGEVTTSIAQLEVKPTVYNKRGFVARSNTGQTANLMEIYNEFGDLTFYQGNRPDVPEAGNAAATWDNGLIVQAALGGDQHPNGGRDSVLFTRFSNDITVGKSSSKPFFSTADQNRLSVYMQPTWAHRKGLAIRRIAGTQDVNFQEWQDNTQTALTVVDGDGHIGIGTASTGTDALHVVGKVHISGDIEFTGSLIGASSKNSAQNSDKDLSELLKKIEMQRAALSHIHELNKKISEVLVENGILNVLKSTAELDD